MTAVRIARAERRIPPGPTPTRSPSHVVVLADDAGHRELGVWLLGFDGDRIAELLDQSAAGADTSVLQARSADELAGRLLHAVAASVTGVDIDELGPEVTAARITVSGPAGTRHVTARLAEGLAVAITTGAPVRVASTVLDRLAVPAPVDSRPGPLPDRAPAPVASVAVSHRRARPRFEPRNMGFADGLDGWLFGGSFTEHAAESHWHDYSCTAEGGMAVLDSAVPRPEGFAMLGQEVFADDYRGAPVVFRGEFRTSDGPGRAGIFLRVNPGRDIRGPLTEAAVFADPDNNIVTFAGDRGWTSHKVMAPVPGDSEAVVFGMFLAGPGRIELRNAELTRST